MGVGGMALRVWSGSAPASPTRQCGGFRLGLVELLRVGLSGHSHSTVSSAARPAGCPPGRKTESLSARGREASPPSPRTIMDRRYFVKSSVAVVGALPALAAPSLVDGGGTSGTRVW